MRANSTEKARVDTGRVGRAFQARGIGWMVLAIFATAALVAWLVTVSTDGIWSAVPVERRQFVQGEIASANVVTWSLVMGFAVAVSVLLLWLVGGWIRVADRVTRRLGGLVAPGVDGGDDAAAVDSLALDTTGEQIDATTSAIATRLRVIVDQRKSLASSIGEVTRDATAMKRTLEQLLDDNDAAGGEALSHLNRFSESTQSLHGDVDSLAGRAEEASSSALQSVAHADEMTESLHRFVGAFDMAAAAGDEALSQTRGLTQRIGDLEADVRSANADAKDLVAGLGQFESQTAEAVTLAERHLGDLAQAISAFGEAAAGIEKLSAVASASTATVAQLGQKIGQITRALSVINEVGEETNLLALNAAIIAAQAGEHGRAFAVVADEIKDLAERVGTSTREIAALVKVVVGESTAALRTIENGMTSVQAAVGASQRAQELFVSVKVGAEGGVGGVRGLAAQLGHESRKAGAVSQAVGRVTTGFEEITRALDGVVESSSRAAVGDEGVRPLSAGLVRSVSDEVRTAKQVVRAVEKLVEIARRLIHSKAEQTKLLAQLQSATARIRGVAVEGRQLAVVVDQVLLRVDRMAADIARSERVLPSASEVVAELR